MQFAIIVLLWTISAVAVSFLLFYYCCVLRRVFRNYYKQFMQLLQLFSFSCLLSNVATRIDWKYTKFMSNWRNFFMERGHRKTRLSRKCFKMKSDLGCLNDKNFLDEMSFELWKNIFLGLFKTRHFRKKKQI